MSYTIQYEDKVGTRWFGRVGWFEKLYRAHWQGEQAIRSSSGAMVRYRIRQDRSNKHYDDEMWTAWQDKNGRIEPS